MLLVELNVPLFNVDSADYVINRLNSEINAPYVRAQKSTLGGPQNVSILVGLSLDPQTEWGNNIFENSRYMRFHITLPNVVELFSQNYTIKGRFRKSRAKSIDGIIEKINQYIAHVG